MAIINLDVDGVVCDFVPGLFKNMKQDCTFVTDADVDLSDPKWRTWDIFTVMPETMKEWSFDVLKDPAFWRGLPVIPYAKEAVEALRAAGHHIQWVTTAWEPCFGWRDARRDWLAEHFAHPAQNIAKDLTVTGRKTEVWADVFVDDKPEAIISWHKHHPAPGHRGILYKTVFNYHHHEDLENFTWSPESVAMLLGWLEEKYGR